VNAEHPVTVEDVAAWWATSVSRIEPGVIELRGRPVQDLIGTTTLTEMIWLLVCGQPAPPGYAELLEAALVAGVDHGPQAPSIAIARMSATCGIGLNGAVATGLNVLGDVHGGAGQQCVELLNEICQRADGDDTIANDATNDATAVDVAARTVLAEWRARSPYIPGFGHRFHPVDPRRDPLLSMVDRAVAAGTVAGRHLAAGRAIERALRTRGGRAVPMNIDGATAVIYAELGLPAPLARGLFVLSRAVGVLAHAWEETQQGRRIKGPIPPGILPAYVSQ
jgi:citrate synthase